MEKISKRPTSGSIIMGINKKMTKGELKWYQLSSDNSIETWRTSEKITDNKAIMYTIYHNMENPETSYLTIHLENRYIKTKSKYTSSDLTHIMTIKKMTHVLILLKKAIMDSGSKVIDYSVIIVENSYDKNLILLTKDKQFDENWVLPGNVLNSIKKTDLVKSELRKYGIFGTDPKIIKYRNIINYGGIYYNINPYVVHSYKSDEIIKRHIWIDKLDISNHYIGPESKKAINFYRKDGLPF